MLWHCPVVTIKGRHWRFQNQSDAKPARVTLLRTAARSLAGLPQLDFVFVDHQKQDLTQPKQARAPSLELFEGDQVDQPKTGWIYCSFPMRVFPGTQFEPPSFL